MSKITIKNLNTGVIIAQGELGENVISMEGNYYFERSLVDLKNTTMKPKAYFCPIKQSSCDYYFLVDGNGLTNNREMAWIYPEISNTLFKRIAGMVGFYSRDVGNGISANIS